MPTWREKDYAFILGNKTLIHRNNKRNRRSPILDAIGAAVGVSALFSIFSGSLSSKEIADV